MVNTGSNFIADFHILWRKPAANTRVLQIIIEALGEGVILVAVADKAGIVFDGIACKQIRDIVGDVNDLVLG